MTTTVGRDNAAPGRGRTRPWRRRILGGLVVLSIMILGGVVAFVVSPWPGAMAVRYVFDRDAVKTTETLDRHWTHGGAWLAGSRTDHGEAALARTIEFLRTHTAP